MEGRRFGLVECIGSLSRVEGLGEKSVSASANSISHQLHVQGLGSKSLAMGMDGRAGVSWVYLQF